MPEARVAVFEGAYCGSGPSGRNGGFCHGYWSYLPTLREVFDDEQAITLCHAGDKIVPGIRAFLEQRGEDAWLHERGMLKTSTTPSQDASVELAIETVRALGHPEEAVAREASRISPLFRRAVFFREGATVHPARLVRALRRAVLDAGIELYEGTRVKLRADGTLNANGHAVRARDVVVATNAAAADWRPVRGRMTVFGSYVVLTEPVPELLAKIGWTDGEAIYDSRMFLHYFRTTDDSRVLMGSGSGPIGYGARIDGRFTHDAATSARAERGLRRLLPDWPARRSSPRGAAPSTSRPTICRSSAPFPGRTSTTGSAIPGMGSARPGSPGRRSPHASPASTTSGPACRSSTARSRRSRPSRSGGSAAGRSAPPSWPARRRRRTDERPRCPRAWVPSSLAPWAFVSASVSAFAHPPGELIDETRGDLVQTLRGASLRPGPRPGHPAAVARRRRPGHHRGAAGERA